MANGTIHNIGTLYVKNIKRELPTRPWASNSTPPGTSYYGNILDYSVLTGDIEIRDTDVDSLYKLKFVEVRIDGKILLVSDRCLLSNISWDTLNGKGFILGKEVIIDGQKYKLRVLTGGTTRRGTDAYSGGTPLTNEWDRIMVNEGGFIGLPTPLSTELNSSQETTDLSGIHNQLWNWVNMYTHVQEVNSTNSSSRNARGYIAAQTFTSTYSHVTAHSTGWRPVLELMNDTLISDIDSDLGEFTTPPIKEYNVTDSNYINLTVVEKINGVILRTFPCQSDEILTLDLSSIWNDLHLSTNTIEIEVTDDWNTKSTRTWTFTKTLDPLPNNSSLKGFVDRAELLSNELSYQKDLLKNSLISRNIEVLESDKMSNLIDKVEDIIIPVKTVVGDTFPIYDSGGYINGTGNLQGTSIYKEFTMFTIGQMRISHEADGNQKSTSYKIIHRLVDKNNNVKSQKEYTIPVNTTITMLSEFDNIKPLDKIQIIYVCDTSWSCQTRYLKITCNIIG